MKVKPSLKFAIAIALGLSASSSFAMDKTAYIAIADEVIKLALSPNPDADQLIAKQEALIELGKKGCLEHAAAAPADATLMNFVASNADGMKNLSLDEIEEGWHDYGALDAAGIDHSSYDHFGPVVGLMDSIVHPATGIIAAREYKATQSQDYLFQIKDELSEVLEHLEHVH